MNSKTAFSPRAGLLVLLAVLALLFAIMFASGFRGDQAHFANDGPLGSQKSVVYKLPTSFFGIWNDQYWLGMYSGNYSPNFTGVMLWGLGPIGFNKFSVPVAMLILAACAWTFFRTLNLSPTVCVLGAIAAALNSNFFSNACWGLSSRGLSLAATFLALAAVQSSFLRRPWLKTVLAGLAIGVSISEGGDNGAIFSIFVAGYSFFLSLTQESPIASRVFKGGIKVALMAVLAGILAAQTINVFIGTSVKGIIGISQAEWSPERKWSWATQWSLPKMESLRVIVPGLFGYRLDTPGGGNYWGGVGQEPGWEEGHKNPEWAATHPRAFPRHSGAGEYAGVIVVVIALWALAHSLVGANGAYSEKERRTIWFWGAAGFIALLLSWGRHAPFYQFIYALPYFSTIRNPMKFMHPLHMVLMILFAYGLQGLWRRYLDPVSTGIGKAKTAAASVFEKKWLLGSGVAAAAAVLAFLVYASSQSALARHLGDVGFEIDAAVPIAKFSIREVGWSVFFLMASLVVVLMISKEMFSRGKSFWPSVLVGAVLVIDLARADTPWIQYYNYKDKYASNKVLEIFAAKPYEGRVTMAMSMCASPQDFDKIQKVYSFTQAWMAMQQVFDVEWLQHQFPFYDIQSIDQPQEPRMPADKQAYRDALTGKLARLYELTNTRFVIGTGGNFADAMNEVFDPVKRRFRMHTRFNLSQNRETGSLSAHLDDNGPFGVLEFTGALPRVKLYSQWEVLTNGPAALAKLADPAFDPQQSVVLSEPLPQGFAASAGTNPGTVEFVSYSPKRIELRADAAASSVLLMNDKIDEGWTVAVDGKATPILRANFLMRGVPLSPGKHTVTFTFHPTSTIFFVGLAATTVGLLLCGFLWVDERRAKTTTANAPASPAPAGAPNPKPSPGKAR